MCVCAARLSGAVGFWKLMGFIECVFVIVCVHVTHGCLHRVYTYIHSVRMCRYKQSVDMYCTYSMCTRLQVSELLQ